MNKEEKLAQAIIFSFRYIDDAFIENFNDCEFHKIDQKYICCNNDRTFLNLSFERKILAGKGTLSGHVIW